LEQEKGPFKHLFRSKGFIWLSNHPDSFFEWSQAANTISVEGAYPWAEATEGLVAEEGASSGDQTKAKDIGARKQSLVFIGQNMSEYKQKIIEEMDKCVVTKKEWKKM